MTSINSSEPWPLATFKLLQEKAKDVLNILDHVRSDQTATVCDFLG